MSTSKDICLNNGDTITFQGKKLSISFPVIIKAIEAKLGITSDIQPKGEAHSDNAQPIDKRTILSMVEEDLTAAKKKENDLLIGGVFGDDDLLDEESQSDASFSVAAHAALGVEILILKRLSKKIRAL